MTATCTENDVLGHGGLRLHYQDWGSHTLPDMLVLHGFGLSGRSFDEIAPEVSQSFHMVCLDQRGHGDSDWSNDGDYSRDAFVGDIVDVVTNLGLKDVVLMGHSMGGMNSAFYTAQNPDRVRALVLVDVGPEGAKEGVDNIIRFTQGPDELDTFDQFVEMAHRFNPRRSIENIRSRMEHRLKQLPNGKWTWKFDKRFRDKDSGLRVGSELGSDELWQVFRSIQCPTLLIRGGQSDILLAEHAEKLVAEMPDCRLEVVEGAGHSVMGDNPQGFLQAVRPFLGLVAAGSR
jgi:pimeloyl-ACP methyl ester carboxylesterase